MKMLVLNQLKKIALLGVMALSVMACSNDDDGGDVIIPSNTIADFVENNQDYSSLNAALVVTGLKSTLASNANFTVFAPNNAAFNEFLSANGFANLNAVPVELLTQVLLNHVQEGELRAADLSTGYIDSNATLSPNGDNLSLYINVGDEVVINGVSTVTTANIEADNGVIHAVDAVIGLPDITTFVLADPDFEVLVAALTREDDYSFVETLQMQEEPAPFTVFAPTNEAFIALLEELEVESLDEIDSNILASALSYHVVTGANVRSEDITDGQVVTTLETGEFTINTEGGVVITDENNRETSVIATDVQATNGVIHVVDQVLLPEL